MATNAKNTTTRRSRFYEPFTDPTLPRSDRLGPIIRGNAYCDPDEEEVGNVKVRDMPYLFAMKTLKQLCLLRGNETLLKQLSKCSNDVHILGDRKTQIQRQLCMELNNCTQGRFGPNECDRCIHLWVDNEADGINNPP